MKGGGVAELSGRDGTSEMRDIGLLTVGHPSTHFTGVINVSRPFPVFLSTEFLIVSPRYEHT